MTKTNMSSKSSLKGKENAKLLKVPEIVLDGPVQSGLVRLEDCDDEAEIIKKDEKNSVTDTAIHESEEETILSDDAALVSIPTERDEEDSPTNHINNTVSTTPYPSDGDTPMAEAYLVQKTFFKTSNGKIKKKCWAFASTVVVLIVCSIIIGITFSTSSKPSTDSSSEVESSNSSPNKESVSAIPSVSPSISPSIFFQPTTNCLNLCLDSIDETDCPNNEILLAPCRLSVVSNLCVDDTKCITDSSSPTCNTNHQIYRRKVCAIDEPWKRSPSGFEFYIETHSMDWESHQERAMVFNASLASIQDENEMGFVNSMLSETNVGKTYIGGLRNGVLSDPLNDGTSKFWKWVDNSTWDFTNWEVGEPDGGQSTNEAYESVALINNMKMIDVFPVMLHQGAYKRKYTGTKKITFSLGFDHFCALNLEDELFCWGKNTNGQLGDGTFDSKNNPTKIGIGGGKKISKIILKGFSTCAIMDDGELKCWGFNYYGQLGDGTKTNRNSPTTIDVGAGQSTTQVSLGSGHSCAVLHNGKAKCWGLNNLGQLGDGTTIDKMIPTLVVAVESQILQITLGTYHTCALLKNTTLTCWGYNSYGQLGDGTNIDKNNAVAVNFDEGRTVEKIATGSHHNCALLDNNTLWCWGRNDFGQLGDNTTIHKYLPTKINVDEERNIKNFTCGHYHTCVLLDDGAIKCWGRNSYGQVGDGTLIHKKYPTEINVGFGRTVTQIDLGFLNTCFTLNDSTLRCWGYNKYGQLGDGTNTNQYYPSKAQYIPI